MKAVAVGGVLECSQLPRERLAVTEDPEHIISAKVLRDVLLNDAHLPWLTLSGSCVPGLHGKGLHVDGDLALSKGFCATGDGELGAVRLLGAHIGGALDLSGAELTNPAGPALIGDGLQVDNGLFFRKGFCATGDGESAAVRLLGAHISRTLDLSGAKLTNPTGPALAGDQLRVDGSLFLRGFRATGDGESAAVRLLGARISGQLNLSEAWLTNENGLILDLEGAEAKVFLAVRAICPLAVAGKSACDHAMRRVDLRGFVYTTHAGDWRQWLHVIAWHTTEYQPQPYQQLAAVQRAAGHDSAARQILIVQQQDRRARGQIGGWWRRAVHSLWGLLGGYGYLLHRIALTLLFILVISGGLGFLAGHIPTSPGRYIAMHTPKRAPRTPRAR